DERCTDCGKDPRIGGPTEPKRRDGETAARECVRCLRHDEVRKAAPDAAARVEAAGWSPNRQPESTSDRVNAAIVPRATAGPSNPNARRATDRLNREPLTGGPSNSPRDG